MIKFNHVFALNLKNILSYVFNKMIIKTYIIETIKKLKEWLIVILYSKMLITIELYIIIEIIIEISKDAIREISVNI